MAKKVIHEIDLGRPVMERARVYGPEPLRQRVALDIAPDVDVALINLAKEKNITKAEITRQALTAYFENMGYQSQNLHEDIGGQKLTRRMNIRSAKQVLFHSQLLIRTFEEALAYDAKRHHNQPPPALHLEDSEYLEELRKLVHELKQLNEFVSQLKSKGPKGAPPTGMRKHLDTFLEKYTGTLGTGAGVMTLGAIATLIYQLGAGEIVFDHVLNKIPGR